MPDLRPAPLVSCTTQDARASSQGKVNNAKCADACTSVAASIPSGAGAVQIQRQPATRKRQAEAVRLHAEGRSIDHIARHLESDPDTVRGWIERKGGAS